MGFLHILCILALGVACVAWESPHFVITALTDSVFSMVRLGAFFLILVIAFYRYLRVCQFKSDDLNSFTATRIVTSFVTLSLVVTMGSFFNVSLESDDSTFWQEAFGLLCFLFTSLYCVITLLMIVTSHVTVPLTNESTSSSTDESQQLLDPKVIANNRQGLYNRIFRVLRVRKRTILIEKTWLF